MGASATIDYNKESIKDKVYTFVLLIKVFLLALATVLKVTILL